jgi:hypothetical protein
VNVAVIDFPAFLPVWRWAAGEGGHVL